MHLHRWIHLNVTAYLLLKKLVVEFSPWLDHQQHHYQAKVGKFCMS